nr:hypothetical protein [uncultured Allomuricauda sp.]
MTKQLHLAAQYLATVAKSFLEAKADDSHTNLGFSVEEKSIQTWPLDEADTKLCLNYEQFSLEWKSHEGNSILLDGKTDAEIVNWLSQTSKILGFEKPYQFDLHYEMPYSMNLTDKFEKSDVKELVGLRTLAQNALKSFIKKEQLTSDIRIWPHHFDSGAFSALDNSEKSVGMGMAIPDSMVNEHYFYISGYKGHDSLDTSTFENLTHGKWLNEGFKGAILPASKANEEIAVQFFSEAFQEIKL